MGYRNRRFGHIVRIRAAYESDLLYFRSVDGSL